MKTKYSVRLIRCQSPHPIQCTFRQPSIYLRDATRTSSSTEGIKYYACINAVNASSLCQFAAIFNPQVDSK